MTREPGPDPDAPAEPANVATLVMDGGTAYVLVTILGMTIDNFSGLAPAAIPAVDVLVHAHDELAGQLGMPVYAQREEAHPLPVAASTRTRAEEIMEAARTQAERVHGRGIRWSFEVSRGA